MAGEKIIIIKSPAERRNKASEDIVSLSRLLSVVLFFVPFAYLVMLLLVKVGTNVDPTEIYVRNISSIVALVLARSFFEYFYLSYTDTNNTIMRLLKLFSLLTGIAGIVKVGISIYYLTICVIVGNPVMWFYVGEIVIWAALSLFALSYYRMLKYEAILDEESNNINN